MCKLKVGYVGDAYVAYFYFKISKEGRSEVWVSHWYDTENPDDYQEAKQDLQEFGEMNNIKINTEDIDIEKWFVENG